jgi:hypothetical protein
VISEARERIERRLAAILTADVVGYSRLMGRDEVGTYAALKAVRRKLIDPRIQEHRGRIFKTTGDGLLVEFASVVDAVRCAVALQREMAGRNAEVSPQQRIEFRIGINLGDVIIDEDDVFGDGVNSRHGSNPWPSLAESVLAPSCETRYAISSISHSRTWATSRSRTSRARYAFIEFRLSVGPQQKDPQR